jgi:hypothetical protein
MIREEKEMEFITIILLVFWFEAKYFWKDAMQGKVKLCTKLIVKRKYKRVRDYLFSFSNGTLARTHVVSILFQIII